MYFNNTSRILSHTSANSNGVILPYSSQILFESDIDSKIKKAKNQIDHFSKAQSHKKTHGGKRYRARQISLRDQVNWASKRLNLLTSAKEILSNLDKDSTKTTQIQKIITSIQLLPNESHSESQEITTTPESINIVFPNLEDLVLPQKEANYHIDFYERGFVQKINDFHIDMIDLNWIQDFRKFVNKIKENSFDQEKIYLPTNNAIYIEMAILLDKLFVPSNIFDTLSLIAKEKSPKAQDIEISNQIYPILGEMIDVVLQDKPSDFALLDQGNI